MINTPRRLSPRAAPSPKGSGARHALCALFVLCGPLAAGCGVEVVPRDLYDAVAERGGPRGGAGGEAGAGGSTPDDGQPPKVAFTTPDDKAEVSDDVVHFEGTASSGLGVASVFVSVGPNVAVAAATDDNFITWKLDAKIPAAGTFQVKASAFDVSGKPSAAPAVITLTRPSTANDAAAPVVAITSPPDKSTPLLPSVIVYGTAGDDRGVVKMELKRNGELQTDRTIDTEDFFGHWSRLVTLLPGEDNELTFIAHDEAGHAGQAVIHLVGPSVADTDAPKITLVSPKDGDKLSTDTLLVDGTAFDAYGVSKVKVRIGTPTGSGPNAPLTWGPYEAATTQDGFATWKASIPVAAGALRLQARAIDINGLASIAEANLQNNFVPVWSDETLVPLRLHDDDPPATAHLELDRQGVGAIIGPDLQKTIKLLDLEPTPLLVNSLGAIKNACGTAWKNDNQDPKHDCSLTPLGKTFKGPDGTWQSSAEYALVRLLTMTPANVVVAGTSIAGLQNIADGAILGITVGGGFNQILSETLGIPRTQEVVTTESAAAALHTEWMASHPTLAPSGNIPVTLYDAMNDLAPLATTLGPAGDHPGVVDPASPPKSILFGPDFKMLLNATSNLRWRDGLDLSKGKDYIAVVSDTKGPTFDDVLEFDFESEQGFDIQGLTPEPTVDLRLKILEDPQFLPSCSGDPGCKGNLPGAPYNNSSVWAKPGWELERIIGAAARNVYKTRVFDKCYIDVLGCKTRVAVGQDGDPPGWANFDILFNLGNPPKAQYLWELINEVAQVALHHFKNTNVPEGGANVAFTLEGVPVGLNADEIRKAVRPYLQDQSSELSKGLLGDYAKNNGAVDFFYQLGQDGERYLYFIAMGDPRPISDYKYKHPGFFDDEALSKKASDSAAGGSGDVAHEKLKLSTGDRTVYIEDDLGGLYRLRISTPAKATDEVVVRVSHHL
jgi:hypothetical protein